MDFDKAKELIIELLRKNGKAKNSEMIDLLDGDRELFERVREDLIFDDIAKDKDNVGLIYISSDQDEAEEAKPEESTDEKFLTRFIFISYGRNDASDLAKKLKKELEAKGHEVWMDICKIRDGKDWEYEIEQAIEKCDVFLSLLSPHAVRRPDGVCLDEISFARYNGKRIIPVMVIPCKPPLCIYRLDWIDFRELKMDDQKALNRLIKEISSDEQYVEGTYAEIFSKLKPIDFGTRISNLTRDFTGREWLIDELNEWLNNEESRVFFVTGDPGVGKSAVMAHLVEKNELVNAYHFCLFHLAESTEPGIFIKSISAQLATQIEGYYEALKGIGDLDDVVKDVKQDADSLFKRLITDPLSKIKQPDSTILIVIDALDESLGVKGTNISSLLRNRLNDLPKWVRLVISSRKEAKIIDTFSEFKPHEIDAGREENIKDINDYVAKKLKEPKIAKLLEENNADPDLIKDAIIKNSENNFLYVTEVIKGIINKSIDLQHPENFTPGLVGLYQDFFNRLFPGGKGYDEIRPLLEIITASREPLTREEIAFFMSCDEFNLRNQLAKINTFFPDRNGRYYPYHKSVIDWLSGDVGKDPTFNINIKRGNNVICNQLLSDRLPDSLKKYKLSHLPAHLASALRFDELKSVLTNFKFIEGKLNQVGIVELIKDYELLPTDVDLRRIQGALRLSANALRRDPNELISQLYGRLMSDNSPVIKGLLNNAMKEIHKPWLKMLQQSLIPPGGSLLYTLEGHTSEVTLVALSRDGKRAVSASRDGTLKIWDMETGEEIRTLKGHTFGVRSVALSRDGKRAVSASWDGTLKIWDIETGEEIRTLEGHTNTVTSVALSEDGKRAVSASYDRTLK
ncbi:TPA: TIR domain-containing protein, partial [Candidatus Poribacteria bacterium]|nr:TIR domain-containing protein [Candidatus Poribacteria bacterium]